MSSLKGKDATVVTGIAKPRPFVKYLSQFVTVTHLQFKDHHYFSNEEITMFRTKSLIITTEKDYIRLKQYHLENVYYLPIRTSFIDAKPRL